MFICVPHECAIYIDILSLNDLSDGAFDFFFRFPFTYRSSSPFQLPFPPFQLWFQQKIILECSNNLFFSCHFCYIISTITKNATINYTFHINGVSLISFTHQNACCSIMLLGSCERETNSFIIVSFIMLVYVIIAYCACPIWFLSNHFQLTVS